MATVTNDRELALQAVSPRIVANDSVLTPPEKPGAVQNYNIIIAEQPGINTQADLYTITTEKNAYNSSVTALTNYLATIPGWNVIPGANVPIIGSVYRSTWENVYTSKQALMDAINNSINGSISGAGSTVPPEPPGSLSTAAEQFGIRIALTESPSTNVSHYEYRVGSSWDSASVLQAAAGSTILWEVQTAGTYTFWAKSVSMAGIYSATAVSTSITIAAGDVINLAGAVSNTDMFLQWTGVQGSFSIFGYEIRLGSTWASATKVDFRQNTSYREPVLWSGSRTYWVALLDVNGNYGTPDSVVVTIVNPSSVTGQRAEVIDNNVLLYWVDSVVGFNQLQVAYYDVRKGVSYAAGDTVGSNGNSTFCAIFEQAAGDFTYWIAPVDSAGNVGVAVSVLAAVTQPPDYILRSDYNSTLNGADPPSLAVTSTPVNFYLENGVLLGPVDVTDSWAQHYVDANDGAGPNTWTTPNAQIAAGYPVYNSVSLTTGSYEEILDYGAEIPPNVVTATINTTTVVGEVPYVVNISHKLLLADNWTNLPAGSASALIPKFRYVKVRYDFTCTAGTPNLIKITALNIKLAIKSRNDSGVGTITTASTGVDVDFIYPFVDADLPVVQPAGSTPLIPVVIYADVAYPPGFTVKLYNLSGVAVTGSFSWSVRGY